MTDPWRGSNVRLRAVEPSDWEFFLTWEEDAESARASYFIPFPRSREAAKKWASELALQEPSDHVFRWVIENLVGEPVGTINTQNCDPRNGTFQYGIAIPREHRRKGYATEAIRLVLTYFFHELRYQKVNVSVYAFNEPSLELHRKLGFQEEGRRRRMIFTNGQFHDEIIFGMTAEEFAESLQRGEAWQ